MVSWKSEPKVSSRAIAFSVSSLTFDGSVSFVTCLTYAILSPMSFRDSPYPSLYISFILSENFCVTASVSPVIAWNEFEAVWVSSVILFKASTASCVIFLIPSDIKLPIATFTELNPSSLFSAACLVFSKLSSKLFVLVRNCSALLLLSASSPESFFMSSRNALASFDVSPNSRAASLYPSFRRSSSFSWFEISSSKEANAPLLFCSSFVVSFNFSVYFFKEADALPTAASWFFILI